MSRSRHFCCCIPVRAGVFLFSLLSFLTSGFLAAVVWYAVHRASPPLPSAAGQSLTCRPVILTKQDGYTNVPKRTEIILIVVGAITTLTALTSFFGYAPPPF